MQEQLHLMAHDFMINLHVPRDSLLPFQGFELNYCPFADGNLL